MTQSSLMTKALRIKAQRTWTQVHKTSQTRMKRTSRRIKPTPKRAILSKRSKKTKAAISLLMKTAQRIRLKWSRPPYQLALPVQAMTTATVGCVSSPCQVAIVHKPATLILSSARRAVFAQLSTTSPSAWSRVQCDSCRSPYQCVEEVCDIECREDSDCGASEVCNDYLCEPTGSLLALGDNCTASAQCESGYCLHSSKGGICSEECPCSLSSWNCEMTVTAEAAARELCVPHTTTTGLEVHYPRGRQSQDL